MDRRRVNRLGASVLLAGVCLALASCGWNRALGPSLELPSPTPGEARTSTPEPVDAAVTPSVPAAHPTPTPRPLCGGPATMLVLAVGADSRDDNYLYGLADVIRVVRVDFVTPKVTVLSFPRDMWVEIPGIEDNYGITHGKLNQSYLYGNPGMGYYDGPGLGPGLLARTLDANFGLRVDHYGAVNMRTFERIVDAVGGIDVYLSEPVDGRPVDDKTEDMGYFTAGQHHFNGEQALRFSRIRKQDNAFMRDDRQTLVLCALREKVLSPQVVTDMPQIIAAFAGSVLTDLSPAQLGQLACLAPRLESKNLTFAGMPEEHLQGGRNAEGTFVLTYDEAKVQALVDEFAAGRWPLEPDKPSCP
jgi:LCP family protein required for cell wall assembly